ncbi:MAG TPA: hypothetical protein VF209_03280 [Patescibacteria group bacterium]
MITLHRELTQHKWAYVVLLSAMLLAVLLFMAAWPSHFWQRIIGLAAAAFYAIWGILTHWRSDHISKHVVYEYLTVAFLGALLLLMVTI